MLGHSRRQWPNIKPALTQYLAISANTRPWPNAGLMLGQRRRWWPNINPALDQRLLFSGVSGTYPAALEFKGCTRYQSQYHLANARVTNLASTRLQPPPSPSAVPTVALCLIYWAIIRPPVLSNLVVMISWLLLHSDVGSTLGKCFIRWPDVKPAFRSLSFQLQFFNHLKLEFRCQMAQKILKKEIFVIELLDSLII